MIMLMTLLAAVAAARRMQSIADIREADAHGVTSEEEASARQPGHTAVDAAASAARALESGWKRGSAFAFRNLLVTLLSALAAVPPITFSTCTTGQKSKTHFRFSNQIILAEVSGLKSGPRDS